MKVTRKHYKCNSQYPCPLLFCIAFSRLDMGGGGGGSRKHRIHFSNRLTLSVEFLRFHVRPVRRTTVYTSTPQSQISSCSVAVSSLSFYMSVHSSIFKKRSTSSTKFLLSSFLKPSFCLLLSIGVSHRSSSRLQLTQIQFLLLRIQPAFLCAMKSKLDRLHPLIEYAS